MTTEKDQFIPKKPCFDVRCGIAFEDYLFIYFKNHQRWLNDTMKEYSQNKRQAIDSQRRLHVSCLIAHLRTRNQRNIKDGRWWIDEFTYLLSTIQDVKDGYQKRSRHFGCPLREELQSTITLLRTKFGSRSDGLMDCFYTSLRPILDGPMSETKMELIYREIPPELTKPLYAIKTPRKRVSHAETQYGTLTTTGAGVESPAKIETAGPSQSHDYIQALRGGHDESRILLIYYKPVKMNSGFIEHFFFLVPCFGC